MSPSRSVLMWQRVGQWVDRQMNLERYMVREVLVPKIRSSAGG
jgi:hypothetical protein